MSDQQYPDTVELKTEGAKIEGTVVEMFAVQSQFRNAAGAYDTNIGISFDLAGKGRLSIDPDHMDEFGTFYASSGPLKQDLARWDEAKPIEAGERLSIMFIGKVETKSGNTAYRWDVQMPDRGPDEQPKARRVNFAQFLGDNEGVDPSSDVPSSNAGPVNAISPPVSAQEADDLLR